MLSKIPYLIAILGMIGGVSIAIVFGANEKLIKDKIANGLAQNAAIDAIEDPARKAEKISEEKDKNWRYYQRYHFHATGIGAMSLSLLLLLGFLQAGDLIRKVAAYFVAFGGFLYPFVWLLAGMYGPEIGRDVAKEKFAVFGYMGGVFLAGAVLTLVLAVLYPVRFPETKKI